MDVLAGSTDVTTYFQLSLLADGADATALTITDIDLQYTRSGSAPTAKVDAVALAATDSAHTDNRAIEIDATDQPGLYRVDWPDAAFASGVREVLLTVKCALVKTQTLRVNLTPVPVNVNQWLGTTVATPGTAGVPSVDAIRISTSSTAADNLETAALAYSATRGLAGTALPAAAADAAGGLIISDAGGLDADAQLVTKINDILTDTGTTLQGELDGIQADTEDILSRIGSPAVSLAADLAALNDISAADVWANGTRTLTSAANITSTGGTTVPQTGDSYAVVNSGTFGNSALNTDLDSLLSRLTSTRAGYLDNLSAGAVATAAALDTVDNLLDTEIAEILTRIGSPAVSLAADLAAFNDLSSAEVQTAAAAALTAYDPPTHAELTSGLASADDATLTAIAALNNLSAAQVNAQVLDVLNVDTYALPGAIAPSATPTLAAALMQLFQACTNKHDQNATEQKVYARDNTTVVQKRTVSDDGTTLIYGALSVGP